MSSKNNKEGCIRKSCSETTMSSLSSSVSKPLRRRLGLARRSLDMTTDSILSIQPGIESGSWKTNEPDKSFFRDMSAEEDSNGDKDTSQFWNSTRVLRRTAKRRSSFHLERMRDNLGSSMFIQSCKNASRSKNHNDNTKIFQDVTEEEATIDNHVSNMFWNSKSAIFICSAIGMSISFREPRFLHFIVIVPLAKMVEIYFKWVDALNERKTVKTRKRSSLVQIFYKLTHPWQGGQKDSKRFLSTASRLFAARIAANRLEATLSAQSIRMSSSDLNKLLIKETEEKLQSYRDISKSSFQRIRQNETLDSSDGDDDAVFF